MNSYVDDMRRELELLVKHHRDVPLPPEDTPEFQVFRPADEARDMIAVDGSYAFLLNLSSWWLALISVGLLRYAFDGRSFHRTDWRLVQRMVGVSTFEEFVAKRDDLHRALFEFTKGALQDQPRDMVNEYRRLIEGQLAINFADEIEGAIVAIDGTLSEFPKQFTFMERLVAVCEKRGHVLVGISKDSQLHAFGHVLTDEDLMLRAQGRLPRGALAYARAPKASEAARAARRPRAESGARSTNTSTKSRGTCDEDRGDRRRVRDRRAHREAPAPQPRGTPNRVPRHRRGRAVRLLLPRRGRDQRAERHRGPARGVVDQRRHLAAAGDPRRLRRTHRPDPRLTPRAPARRPRL